MRRLLAIIFFMTLIGVLIQWQRVTYLASHERVWLSQFPIASSGPFKGLLVGYWWVEAQNLQQEFKFEEVEKLTRKICYLQPYNPLVWEYLSWNLSFNLMAESMFDRKVQTYWLLEGIRQLQKGLEYNPDNNVLEYALAWTTFLKTQGDFDFSKEMSEFLGEHPIAYSKKQMINSEAVDKGEFIMGLQAVQVFFNSGDVALAIASCHKLIKRFPQHRESMLERIGFIESVVKERGQ